MSTITFPFIPVISIESDNVQINDKELQSLIQDRIKGKNYFRTKNKLKNHIRKLNSSEIHAFLKTCAGLSSDQAFASDPIKAFENCASLHTLEQIEEALKTEYDTFDSSLNAALEMVEKARYFIDQNGEKHLHGTVKSAMLSTLQAIENTIETVLTAFGLIDFFSAPDSEFAASFRVQKMMMLTTILSGIATVILAVVGTPLASFLVVGGLLLALAIFTALYVKLIKSTPSSLPECTNLTELTLSGDLQNVQGRKEKMDQMANTLNSPANFKIHPLLVGPTGVGKTETIRGFARALAQGDYPELKGKKIFYLNCANIKTGGQGGLINGNRDILKKISKAMGRHRENIILVLDEIHVVTQEGKQGKVGESLKTWLENWKENFPYVIGATTDKEFEKYIKSNEAFSRRFRKISMNSLSDNENEVVKILNNLLIQYAPHIQVEKGVIRELFRITRKTFPNDPEPYMSRMILTECIKVIEEVHHSENKKKLTTLKEQKDSLLAEDLLNPLEEALNTQQLSNQIANLQSEVDKEKKELQKLLKTRDQITQTKRKLFTTTLNISKSQERGQKIKEHTLKSHLLLRYYLNKALITKVESNGMKLKITHELVSQVIADVKKNREEHETMLQNTSKLTGHPKF